jgi:hypothetical protein
MGAGASGSSGMNGFGMCSSKPPGVRGPRPQPTPRRPGGIDGTAASR